MAKHALYHSKHSQPPCNPNPSQSTSAFTIVIYFKIPSTRRIQSSDTVKIRDDQLSFFFVLGPVHLGRVGGGCRPIILNPPIQFAPEP